MHQVFQEHHLSDHCNKWFLKKQLYFFLQKQVSIENTWCIPAHWRFASYLSLFSTCYSEVEDECGTGQRKYRIPSVLTLQVVFVSAVSLQCCVISYNFLSPARTGRKTGFLSFPLSTYHSQGIKSVQQYLVLFLKLVSNIYKEYSSHYFPRFPLCCLTHRSVSMCNVKLRQIADDPSY